MASSPASSVASSLRSVRVRVRVRVGVRVGVRVRVRVGVRVRVRGEQPAQRLEELRRAEGLGRERDAARALHARAHLPPGSGLGFGVGVRG